MPRTGMLIDLMVRRANRAMRCPRCRLHQVMCLCGQVAPLTLETRLAMVMHHREALNARGTGPLALAALANSECHLHGLRDAPLDLGHLDRQGRRVLVLFPCEGARPLSRQLQQEDPRPVTLVVFDGSWRQTRRLSRRIPGLDGAERVMLAPGPPSLWGLGSARVCEGLSTFEAIARALGILESAEVQASLDALLLRWVRATTTVRGDDRRAATPAVSDARAPVKCDDLRVLYLDEHLVAVNKPAGLATHRGWARDGDAAVQKVRDQLGRFVYPVHRLDRATSGVLLFALSSEVARDMQDLFARAAVQKHYLALCRGRSSGLVRVDHPLASDTTAAMLPAVTDFRLLGTFERYGLYEAWPRTGRTHQVRRHLKHASHPIIGDVRYGKGEHNRIFRTRFGFHQLALHCHRLVFDHPRKPVSVDLQAALTAEFESLLTQIGLSDVLARVGCPDGSAERT